MSDKSLFSSFRPKEDSWCRNCEEVEETFQHVLSECPLREFKVDGNGKSFVPTLYGDVSKLRDTAAFVRRALREQYQLLFSRIEVEFNSYSIW
jgi:hypothetical protein